MAEQAESIDCGVSETRLSSWRDFIQHVDKFCGNAFVYRGQSDARWKIESTLDRLEARFPTSSYSDISIPPEFPCPPVIRRIHLEAFKESVRGKRGPNPGDLSENEWWALAQHHGLATPLLDWTYSPFVALFFAFEEAGYIDWQPSPPQFCEPKERVFFVVAFHQITENDSSENPPPELFSPRREITHRLSSQCGVLMKMPEGTDLEASVRARLPEETSSASNRHARPILRKIIIPNKEREECLKLLDKMNINRMSLFADLDGAARYINSLWELGFKTALGAIPGGTETLS